MQAVSVTETSVSLAWDAVADAVLYRVYSDMGTGYGVYVLKGETPERELVDSGLRAGARYLYRVTSLTPSGEAAAGWAQAITPGAADFQGSAHSPAASADHAPAAIAAQPSPASIRVTPAPTPLPPDTVILGLLSSTDYTSEVDNTLTIVGEVRNDSHLDVGETAVAATLYGNDGQPIDEVTGATLLSALTPGVRSPFAITVPDPSRVANYSLRATGRPITLVAGDGQLTVITTRRFEDPAGFYHVAGVVENPGDGHVEQARVIVTLYDRGGRVVNVGFAYPQPPSMSAGERADFDVAFTYYPKVYSHAAMAVED